MKSMKNGVISINHNTLAIIIPIVVAVFIVLLVRSIPEIGIAPVEEIARTSIKMSLFMAAWPLSLRFLGGLGYSITEHAKQTQYGMTLLSIAVIIGLAITAIAK